MNEMLAKMCKPMTAAVRYAMLEGFLLFLQDAVRLMTGESIPTEEISQAMGQPAIEGPKPAARKKATK